MSEMIKKTNDFNKKYIPKIIDGKKGPGVFSRIFKSKTLTETQMYYLNRINSKNIFQLLDSEAEMKKSDRRNFEAEYKKLFAESTEFRKNHATNMNKCVNELRSCLDANMEKVQGIIQKFNQFGYHSSQMEQQLID